MEAVIYVQTQTEKHGLYSWSTSWVSVAISTTSTSRLKEISLKNINNKLLHAALGTSAILGDRYHDNLTDKQSKSEAQDWDAIQRLSRFNESMGTAFVYSVVKRAGKAYLVSSSASKKRNSREEFRTILRSLSRCQSGSARQF